eukprot:scaffold19909_cov130-Isochrysis_galbana.AAC.4
MACHHHPHNLITVFSDTTPRSSTPLPRAFVYKRLAVRLKVKCVLQRITNIAPRRHCHSRLRIIPARSPGKRGGRRSR